MKPLRLYIENFLCHSISYIDFTSFESALIIARINDNESLSNGAGKTSVFKAIEYVLFNKIDMRLDSVIRDDCNYCRVVFDFEDEGEIYRVSRYRTKKSTDFALFRKINDDDSGLSILSDDEYHIATDSAKLKDDWKNLSGTRDADTDKELFKIIKTNYKSFISTVHFLQNDFSGIATATPERRKQILKDALELSLYSKLEKAAKDKYSKLSKEADKISIVMDTIGDASSDILKIKDSIKENKKELNAISCCVDIASEEERLAIDNKNTLEHKLSEMKNSVSTLVSARKGLTSEINTLQSSLSDYENKKVKVISSAKNLVSKLETLSSQKNKLESIDLGKITLLEKENVRLQKEEANYSAVMQASIIKHDDLSIPLPNDDLCKHCRQKMTKAHKEHCKKTIKNDMAECQKIIKDSKIKIKKIRSFTLENNAKINELNSVKIKLESLCQEIKSKKKELSSKKAMHKEYSSFIGSQKESLENKNKTLAELELKIDKSSLNNIKLMEKDLDAAERKCQQTSKNKSDLTKKATHLRSTEAVLKHNLKEKERDKSKLIDLTKQRSKLNVEMQHYPSVINAFGTSGIPNLIIQNVLDDLQVEANQLLEQLRPGLQLEFVIEKENSNDTLDITYYYNGRKRYYEQISGAMKISVLFSLKMGLSFLLQKMMGFNIPLLLLDEIDQSLDKAGVDAFANIVKFFQKDFKILVITHNDRLKDKIPNLIVVNQDINKVSQAKVVNYS